MRSSLLWTVMWFHSSFAQAESCGPVIEMGVEWPQIEVISAGAEPRRPLRIRSTENDTERRRLEMSMSMAYIGEDGAVPSIPYPVLVFDVETRVLSVDAEGVAEISFAYLSADAHAAVGVPPEILQEIRDSVRTMTGLRGTYLTNSCLYADAIEFDEHPGLDSRLEEQNTDLRSSPGLMSDPLPTEAVGIGAQWRVSWVRVENPFIASYNSGIRLEQEAVYTLVSMDEDGMSLIAEVRHWAAGDVISHPGLPGTLVELRNLEAEGRYTVNLEFDAILPVSATSEVSTEQQTVLDRGRGEELRHHELRVHTSLEPLAE